MIGADPPTVSLLTELLRSHLDPELTCTGLRRAETGNAQEIWFVDAARPDGGELALVLRRSAADGSLAHTSRDREAQVLRALADSDLPVPRVRWAEGAGGALGRPYLVMERLPGRPPAVDDPAVARELGGWLARLHAVPADRVPGGEGLDAAGATARELAGWRRRHARSRTPSVPLLGPLLAWLEANPPTREGVEPRLIWGDPGAHNVLVEDGRIVALLDWELWHHGDPLEDLGAALWALEGAARDELVAGYEALAGPLDREALAYFEAMACVSRSVMLQAGVDAFLAGRPRPGAAGLGHHLLLSSLGRAAELAGWEGAGVAPDPPPRELPSLRLRPDATETADGVAAFLAAEILPTVSDRRLRRELKVAVALLRDAASRAAHEEPAPVDLEAEAAAAETTHSPARAELRRALLADLAARRSLVANVDALYERSGS